MRFYLFIVAALFAMVVWLWNDADGLPSQTADGEYPQLPKPGASWERIMDPAGSLIAPAAHLDAQGRLDFYSGLSFFKQPWIRAPASTTARDGLGPLFNSNSCFACHVNGGRSSSPIQDPGSNTSVLRVSVLDAQGRVVPHPVYGDQIQTRSIFDRAGEAQVAVAVTETTVSVGARDYVLREPQIEVHDARGVPLEEPVLTSLRVAPSLIGMGLLEAIPVARLEALEDAADADNDGISGRIHWLQEAGQRSPGRFGWKATHTSVAAQTGSAFRNDMGITNRLFPNQPCSPAQATCLAQLNGNDAEEGVEIVDQLFDLTVFFTSNIPPPHAGEVTPAVAQGRDLFHAVGCQSCHTPSHKTVHGEVWPYTDLLLHDLGPGLADGRPDGDAQGREWRTAPLWGLGTQKRVSGHTQLLHDGRARNLVEAVLWHGGEAAAVREKFLELSDAEIDALRAFIRAI
ncbi:MAG: di-heme oxidoredictase family protein [Pseudomonadota bacterium]